MYTMRGISRARVRPRTGFYSQVTLSNASQVTDSQVTDSQVTEPQDTDDATKTSIAKSIAARIFFIYSPHFR